VTQKVPVYFTRDEEDNEVELELPWKWVICPQCEGRGTSSAYLGAFCSDEWAEMDPEWKEDYMAGRFDRACPEGCEAGKVKVVDRDRVGKEELAAYDEQQKELAEIDHIERMERRMEGGWRDEY
jgi:hypothetical protein